MATFNPDTFTNALKQTLPHARVSVRQRTKAEREAAWAALHTLNAEYNHAPTLGHGTLQTSPLQEQKQ